MAGGAIPEAVYRTYTAGEPDAFTSMTEYFGAGGACYAYAPVNTIGRKLDTKCRFFNADDDGSYYSPLLTVDPMAMDNTAPAVPTLTAVVDIGGGGTLYHFNVSAKTTALHVAYMRVQRLVGSTWTDVAFANAQPEVAVSGSFDEPAGAQDKTVSIRAFAYSSYGTVSSVATYSYTIPGSH